MSEAEKTIIESAKRILLNRKIVNVRYITKQEAEDLGWYRRSIAVELDDGTFIFPSSDDEGNNGGALFTTHDDMQTIPVIP